MKWDVIEAALAEDIGDGDVTSLFFVPKTRMGRAVIFAKESCIAAGVEVAAEVFARVDEKLHVTSKRTSGAALAAGDVVLEIEGSVRSILTGERTALNFVQRLSGVATLTRSYVEAAAKGGGARILDTRKTTPGLRLLEKAAVLAGGGTNHRIGLYDRAMVKDNHLLAEGRGAELQAAILRLKQAHPGMVVELEADTLAQVELFLSLDGVEIILLDNMDCATMAQAVALRLAMSKSQIQFEASGGVTLETVRAISATGVDFISVGALTHSARAMDFSLELAC